MAEFAVRPMPGEAGVTIARHHWVVEKRCRSLSITQEAWKILGAFAVDCGNRSEALEIITRYAWNAKLDLCSIRTELLNPEAAAKAGLSTLPNPTAEQPDTGTAESLRLSESGVDACGLNPPVTAEQPQTCGLTAKQPDTCGVDIDFDAPVQCSI